MELDYTAFRDMIDTKKPIHLVGIGGVSMRALAGMLLDMGASVSGSDRDDSEATERLRESGIPVAVGHDPENVRGKSLVIRTAAVPDSNPEIAAAREAGIPVIERAEAWGLIMSRYAQAVCIAGTHGKTSTTSMAASMAMEAGLDPTVMVGGELPRIGGTLRIGRSPLFIAEACEYKNSYHSFTPRIAVILNVDHDHPDFFKDTNEIVSSFRRFAELVPREDGVVIANLDDSKTMRAVRGVSRRTVTFGMSDSADIYPRNVSSVSGYYHCDVWNGPHYFCHIGLSVPGLHNLYNALACAAIAVELGISGEAFEAGVNDYTGVGRRFELKREWRGATVYDDYAHHPSEIQATLMAAKSMAKGRVICIFQPHTFSRTDSLLEDFADTLSLADIAVICPIFAAREENTSGVSSADLAQRIPGALAADSLAHAAELLRGLVQPGDMIFTMGAGDVYKVAEMLEG